MAEETTLQEAIEAIRQGDDRRAKELLTRLIKDDQYNPTYWNWMSAVVETKKERIYCLQTALRIDPENVTAKRGLIIFGVLPPDKDVKPFPISRKRRWEADLIKSFDAGKPKVIKGFLSGPVIRLVGLLVVGILVISLAVFGLLTPRLSQSSMRNTVTPGPSPTYSPTPTFLNDKPAIIPTFTGPTPLWMLLIATYTPTPLYVNTPHSIQAIDYYRAAEGAYKEGKWSDVINAMQQIAAIDPGLSDPYYYIGEAYRFQGQFKNALGAYDQAIALDPNFGPAYVGRARVLPGVDQEADILTELNRAIESDPNFAEAYLERAAYLLSNGQPYEAREDLEHALTLSPDSPLVYLGLAKVDLALGDNLKALQEAKKTNSLDITMIPAYLTLGEAYEANSQLEKAVGAMEIYVQHQPGDTNALVLLGGAYNAVGKYEEAVDILTQALRIKRTGKAYIYRGLAYVGLDDGENAEHDLKEAIGYLPGSFEGSLGLARAYRLEKHYGDCYLQIEHTRSLIENNEQTALIYYWRATCLEGLNNLSLAAKDWQALLDLSVNETTSQMRAEALKHLYNIRTPTPTPTATKTPTSTKTPMVIKTP